MASSMFNKKKIKNLSQKNKKLLRKTFNINLQSPYIDHTFTPSQVYETIFRKSLEEETS